MNTPSTASFVEDNLVEETICEQQSFYLLAKPCEHQELFDRLWHEKFSDRQEYRLSDLELQADWLDLVKLQGQSEEQAEIYLAHQIFKHKLKSKSFADADLERMLRQFMGLALVGV